MALDLTNVASGEKAKLPDGREYELVSAEAIGPLPLQRIVQCWQKAMALADRDVADIGEDEAQEMLGFLVDAACVILPDAPREVVGQVSFRNLQRLISTFFEAFPAAMAQVAGKATSGS